jgi:transcriptional regulator
MYVPAHFALSDVAAVHSFLRSHVFATIAGEVGGNICFAYAPIVLDTAPGPLGGIRFHLARANPLAASVDGARLAISVMGPHAYVSPDWYASDAMVPTWNYVAAEGAGRVRRLCDAGLRRLLAELTVQEESALRPKTPWAMGRVPPERLDSLLSAIAGFELVFETLEGKAKLSQNRSQADREGAIKGLQQRGDAASLAVAATMENMRARKEP